MIKAIIKKAVSSIKLHPNFESEAADEALYGMIVQIDREEKDCWYYIKTHYDYYGYIHRDDLLFDNKMLEIWSRDLSYVIDQPLVDVMSLPKYASNVIITLPRGAIVQSTGIIEDKWEQIKMADGVTGWIRKGFANRIAKLNLSGNEDRIRMNIVDSAMKYMGVQYRWGGKSPIGIDCSGLASMAYMLNGYIIPRDADIQQEYLKPVKRTELMPGDLMFFPGHVAVYIGDQRYIHATGREGYVLINSFNPDDSDYREDLDKECTGTGTLFGMGV